MPENEHVEKLRKQLFVDQMKRDAKWSPKANRYTGDENEGPEEDKSLEKIIAEFFTGYEKNCHQATEDEIAELESKSGRPIPAALKDMWLTIPGKNPAFTFGPRGFSGAEDMIVDRPSPAVLLAAMAKERAYEQLRGLGILNYLHWLWGNDQPFLSITGDVKPEYKSMVDTTTTPEQRAEADTALTCFGHLQDGYCEGHLVLHYDKDGVFGATEWIQGESYIPMKPTFTGFKTPEALILKCLAGCDAIDNHPDQEDPESPYSTIDILVEWMKSGEVNLDL